MCKHITYLFILLCVPESTWALAPLCAFPCSHPAFLTYITVRWLMSSYRASETISCTERQITSTKTGTASTPTIYHFCKWCETAILSKMGHFYDTLSSKICRLSALLHLQTLSYFIKAFLQTFLASKCFKSCDKRNSYHTSHPQATYKSNSRVALEHLLSEPVRLRYSLCGFTGCGAETLQVRLRVQRRLVEIKTSPTWGANS